MATNKTPDIVLKDRNGDPDTYVEIATIKVKTPDGTVYPYMALSSMYMYAATIDYSTQLYTIVAELPAGFAYAYGKYGFEIEIYDGLYDEYGYYENNGYKKLAFFITQKRLTVGNTYSMNYLIDVEK